MTYYTKTNSDIDFIKYETTVSGFITESGINRPNVIRTSGALSPDESAMTSGIYTRISSGINVGQFIAFDIRQDGHGIFNYRDQGMTHKQIRF